MTEEQFQVMLSVLEEMRDHLQALRREIAPNPASNNTQEAADGLRRQETQARLFEQIRDDLRDRIVPALTSIASKPEDVA